MKVGDRVIIIGKFHLTTQHERTQRRMNETGKTRLGKKPYTKTDIPNGKRKERTISFWFGA
jgi:hypothetical protein